MYIRFENIETFDEQSSTTGLTNVFEQASI